MKKLYAEQIDEIRRRSETEIITYRQSYPDIRKKSATFEEEMKRTR